MPRRRGSTFRQNALQALAIFAVFVATRMLLFTKKDAEPIIITETSQQTLAPQEENATTRVHLTVTGEGNICPTIKSTEVAADKLKTILRQMKQYRSGHKQRLFRVFEEQLVEITQSLDPLYDPRPSLEPVIPSTRSREFCVDNFTHLSNAEPHYFLHGSWESDDCKNLKPLEKLVSILLYAGNVTDDCTTNSKRLLAAIFNTHPLMEVYVASDPAICQISPLPNVDYSEVRSDWNYGHVWNSLVKKVKTPYVLVGRHLENFSWLTEIRRQLSIVSQLEQVNVVGGSIRNATGYWQVGCYQTSLDNNVLEYKDGYYSSTRECMFCDHLLGPFVANTTLLKEIPLNEDLSQAVIFDDWFLQLKKTRHLVMNCPDAMYFFTDPDESKKLVNRTIWLPLVETWQLNRIFLPDNVELAFSCEESGILCTHNTRVLPICCVDQFAYNMHVFHELCLERKVWYNYIGGYVLGAIKHQGIMPWEMFASRQQYFAKEKFLWEGSVQKVASNTQHSIFIDHIEPGFSVIWSPDISNETQATSRADTEQMVEEIFILAPTVMRVHGVWVYGPPSPGLHARNVYGKDYLKQTNVWEHLGKGTWNYQTHVESFLQSQN